GRRRPALRLETCARGPPGRRGALRLFRSDPMTWVRSGWEVRPAPRPGIDRTDQPPRSATTEQGPAVDLQDLPGGPAAARTGQVAHGRGDLLRRARAAERDLGQPRGDHLFGQPAGPELGVRDEAGSDRV